MAPAEGALHVSVVYSPRADAVEAVPLVLAPGATVADAVRASGLVERHALDLSRLGVAVWGRVQPLDRPLREHDRIELCRGLQVDPKEARRLRYRGQGKRRRTA